MRIFTATLIHETNSFSPIPTDLDSYREVFLYRPTTGEGAKYRDSLVADINFSLLAAARGHDAVQGLIAGAQPSAPTSAKTWALLKGEVLENLDAAGPLDAVVLFLHGAQMAAGCPDCEGDLLLAVRQRVGTQVIVAAELDLHANVSAAMVREADLLVSCQEYPHTDFEARANHLLDLVERAVRRQIRPTTALARVPLFGSFHTTREPMRSFVDRTLARQSGDCLSVSLIHGFAWSDTADAGASVLVTSDNDLAAAEKIARQLAREFFALRDEIVVPAMGIEAALDRALIAETHPVVIADTTDNPGGGAPGDSTWLLRAMLKRGMSNVALAMIWDPSAVELAWRAGVGANLPLRLGGKVCALSGDPVDAQARVLAIRDDAVQLADSSRRSLGRAAVVRMGGIDIVINSDREQTFTRECFTELGIDPTSKSLLVVKSHQHFYEDFSKLSAEIIYATPPGVVARDFAQLSYTQIVRPVWPLDQPPFKVFGQDW